MQAPSRLTPNPHAGPSATHRSGPLAAVLAVAVVARALALWQFGDQLGADPDGYRMIAENIVAGRGFGYPPGHVPGSPTAYRPPLYPGLLVSLVMASGGNENLLLGAIAIFQGLLGTGAVWLCVLIGRRLDLGPARFLAGLLVAVDPLLLHATSLVMTETTATFLVVLCLWLALRARSASGWFAVGTAFGACCLCRPTFWAFGALIAVGWLICRWRHRGVGDSDAVASAASSLQSWKAAAAPVVAGMALAIAPWVARNAISMGEPILTTTHGGYTLLLAHNPFYTRAVVDRPWGAVWNIAADADWSRWLSEEIAESGVPQRQFAVGSSPADEILRDRWMSQRAWRTIREEPWTAARSGLTLLGRLWSVVPRTTENRTLPAPLRWLLGAFFAATYFSALIGAVRLSRREWSLWWPLPVLLLSFTLVHALYWADMRMRAPLVPAIALLAARSLASRPLWRLE